MNPDLKSILQQVNGGGDIFEDLANTMMITDDSQNDLINSKTIDHYIGKAFS
jgi:hypothetical protein